MSILAQNRVRFAALTVCLLLLVLAILALSPRLAAQDTDELPNTAAMDRFLANRGEQDPGQSRSGAVVPCVGGMAGIYPCNKVDLMSSFSLGELGASDGNDSWGWTDPLNGDEYAIMGVNNGTVFIDITDPVNPIYLGKLPTQTSNSTWRDIKVYADHAFIVSEASSHGMQIFDLTQLRSVASPPVTFSNTAHYNGFGDAHNIVINEDSGYAYAVGANVCSGGLHMIDISSPTSPVGAGCFSADGYTHDAQCVNYAGPDPDHQGKEICFNSNTDTLTIVDVTNKGAPAQLSRTGYSGVGYTHQGWLTEDHTYFLLGDEQDESNFGHNTRTRIWDVSDLDNPSIIGFFDGRTPSIDHNLYTHNGFAYEANYTSGLSILDLTNVASGALTETAYFDNFPSNNSTSFSGAWSVYPYFSSGLVVISSDNGFFLVKPYLIPDFTIEADDSVLSVCNDGSDVTTLSFPVINGYASPITLSALGLPGGASDAYSVNPVTPPTTSDLTVTTSGVGAGDYAFEVQGVGGGLTHTAALTLSVFSAAPGSVSLVAPADGGNNVNYRPTFQWTAATQGQSYLLEVDDDAGFGSPEYTAVVNGISHKAETPLPGGTTLYWRVTAQNACGSGSSSATWSFTTLPASLSCTNTLMDFNSGLPEDWVVANYADAAVVWSLVSDPACNRSNQTGGSGDAACADSLSAGPSSGGFDTALISPPLDLSAYSTASLTALADYNDLNSGSNDRLEVDVWDGSSWTTELTWDEDHSASPITVDLSAYTGQNDIQVRFRYSSNTWTFYAQLDDIGLSCSGSAPGGVIYMPIVSGE